MKDRTYLLYSKTVNDRTAWMDAFNYVILSTLVVQVMIGQNSDHNEKKMKEEKQERLKKTRSNTAIQV